MNLIIGRYLLYSLIAIEVLLLPKLLPVDIYTELEYYKFILYFIPFLLFGANSGYVYFKYNNQEDYFTSLFAIGTFYFILISIGIYVYIGDLLLSIVIVLMAVFMLIEQRVKTEKKFILAMSVKPIISLVLVMISILYYYKLILITNIDFLYYAIIIAFVIWLSAVLYEIKDVFITDKVIKIKYFFKLIHKGFLISIGTLLLMALFFTDRYFTKEFYPDYLGTYSFSYNIVQFIILALTTLAYVNVVEIGENMKNINLEFIKQKIYFSYRIFTFLFIFFTLFVIVLAQFYDFKSLLYVSLVMGFFMGSFYAINSIAAIVQYKDLLAKLTMFMLAIVVLNILLSYVFIYLQIDYHYFILKTGILLSIYSLYLLQVIFRKVVAIV